MIPALYFPYIFLSTFLSGVWPTGKVAMKMARWTDPMVRLLCSG
jgi:hypothetical protein